MHMATHIQRKRFEHRQLAIETQKGFDYVDPSIPGAEITAEVREIGGELWLYVTQTGNMVIGDEPLLPNYERVDA
jgi:hypothetical protein